MGKACGNCAARVVCCSVDQPPDNLEWTTADGIFIKEMQIANAGTVVPQHSHVYAHTSLLQKGAVGVWSDGEYQGVRKAPTAIHIPANVKHSFQAMEDNTVILCIHNLNGAGYPPIAEEHQLEGV